MFEDTWTARPNVANAVRVHVLQHTLGTTPRDSDVGIIRPSVLEGQTNADAQVVPRRGSRRPRRCTCTRRGHDVKLGGELAFGIARRRLPVLENGFFASRRRRRSARTSAGDLAARVHPAGPDVEPLPVAGSRRVRAGRLAAWRAECALNTGLRYDIDFNLRLNELLRDGSTTPPGRPRSVRQHAIAARTPTTCSRGWAPRGNARGDGALIVRGGWGLYVTRNRPVVSAALDESVREQRRAGDATAATLRSFRIPRPILGGSIRPTDPAPVGGRAARHAHPGRFRARVRDEHDRGRRVAGRTAPPA